MSAIFINSENSRTFRTISNASSKSTKHWLINLMFKNMSKKFRMDLHSRSKPGTILKS